MAGERQRMNDLCDSIDANVVALRKEIDSAFPAPPAPGPITLRVKVGESVQNAYDTLVPTGGIIRLAPGRHNGDLKFVERAPDAKVIIFTSDTENLPPPDKRISPDYLPALGVLAGVTMNQASLRIQNKARQVTFACVGFAPPPTKSYTHVDMGGDKNTMKTPADRPDAFIWDRCYFFGDPILGAHRGIALNGSNIIVRKSYFKDIFEPGRDCQAMAGWNGGQNILIDDTYLEGGAQCLMFGGSDSASPEMTCQDIIVRACDFYKNYAWMLLPNQPSIKCHFEIKNVKRLLMENCLFQQCWARDWATGVSIMLKACNGENIETWATCEDVELRNLVIRRVGSVFGLIGKNDSNRESDWMRRIKITNILAYDINVDTWKGTGRGVIFTKPCQEYFDLDHITYHTNQHSWMYTSFPSTMPKGPHFGFTNSIVAESDYGYFSESSGVGFTAIPKDWTSSQVEGNVYKIGTRTQGITPANNLRLTPAQWDDSFYSDHSIKPESEAAKVKTTDGKLPGAEVALLKENVPQAFI